MLEGSWLVLEELWLVLEGGWLGLEEGCYILEKRKAPLITLLIIPFLIKYMILIQTRRMMDRYGTKSFSLATLDTDRELTDLTELPLRLHHRADTADLVQLMVFLEGMPHGTLSLHRKQRAAETFVHSFLLLVPTGVTLQTHVLHLHRSLALEALFHHLLPVGVEGSLVGGDAVLVSLKSSEFGFCLFFEVVAGGAEGDVTIGIQVVGFLGFDGGGAF